MVLATWNIKRSSYFFSKIVIIFKMSSRDLTGLMYMSLCVFTAKFRHHYLYSASIVMHCIQTSHRTATKWKWQWLTIMGEIKWLPEVPRDLWTSINWTTNPLNDLILWIQLWEVFITTLTRTIDNKWNQ